MEQVSLDGKEGKSIPCKYLFDHLLLLPKMVKVPSVSSFSEALEKFAHPIRGDIQGQAGGALSTLIVLWVSLFVAGELGYGRSPIRVSSISRFYDT